MFTDEDFKRMKKEWTSRTPKLASDNELKMLALLTRLEAAERCVDNAKDHIDFKFLDAWRKSAGR